MIYLWLSWIERMQSYETHETFTRVINMGLGHPHISELTMFVEADTPMWDSDESYVYV